jgi:hypothetical protein
MTIDITDNLFTHQSGSRMSVATRMLEGPLRLRVKNGKEVNVDELTYLERVEFARFLLADLPFGANLTVQDFAGGTGGPNEREDRIHHLASFDGDWRDDKQATDLTTWTNHQDYSRVDGDWYDRIKEYYKEHGY